MSITLSQALEAIQASAKKAEEIKVPMVIAVTDVGGHLIAEARMDGAIRASIKIAMDKAYTCCMMHMPTDALADPTQPGASLYGLQNLNNGELCIFGGGFPVKRGGVIVGAIGVSGGSVEEDMDCAKVGLALLEKG